MTNQTTQIPSDTYLEKVSEQIKNKEYSLNSTIEYSECTHQPKKEEKK